MNRLFTKIAGIGLSFAMAIGVGVAIARNREIAPAKAASDSTQYALISSTSDLEAGKSYIFTNGTTGTVNAMSTTDNANNRRVQSTTVSDGKITRGENILSVTLGGTTGAWTFATENYAGTDGYFASAASGKNNYLRVIATAGTATISFSDGEVVINIGPHTERKRISYNSQNGGLFACYSSKQSAVYMWKEVSAFTVTYNKNTTDTVTGMPENASASGNFTLSTATPVRAGYTFGGWSTTSGDNNGANRVTSINVTANVTVYAIWTVAKTPASLALSGTYTTQFAKNAEFEHTGLVATVTYTDSTTKDVTANASFSNPDMTTAGQKTVTVSYTENAVQVSANYNITVLPEVNSVTLNKNSTTINLGASETLVATVDADQGAEYTVVWTTSDDTVAEVDGGVVTASSTKIGTATITATAGSKSASCVVTVNDPNAVTDVITASAISNPSSYSAWSNKTLTSDAVYAGYSTGGNSYIQIRTSDSSSGIVTTASGGTLKSISVTFTNNTLNGRIVEVYAKNSAYSQASDLFSAQSATTGVNIAHLTCNGSNNTVSYVFEDDYTFFGIRSNDGALYLANITVLWSIKPADDPEISITSGTDGVMSGKLGDIDTVTYDVDYKEKTPGDYSINWAVTDSESILDFDDGDFEFVAIGADATITVQLKKGNSIIDSDSVKARVLAPTVTIKALSGENVVANALLVEKDAEGQLGFDVTNEPDSLVTYEWSSTDDGTYFMFDDTDGTYVANENTTSPVELTLTMKYDGTAVASNTIEITVDTLTGLVPNGNYYIMNHFMSFGMTADVTGTSNPPSGALVETENNTIHPFAFRLVDDDTYEITTTVNATTYYLVNRNKSTSSSNNNVRLVNASDAEGYVRTWVLTDKDTDGETSLGTYNDNGTSRTLYNLKENTTGTTWRYLSAYYQAGADFRGYVSPYNSATEDLATQDSKLNLIPEGIYADAIADAIMSNEQGKTLCDGGTNAPSTTLWENIAGITNIENELKILRGTTAAAKNAQGETPDGTTREKAMARYDEIMVRYNTSLVTTYADFLGRIEAQNLVLQSSFTSLLDADTNNTAIIVVVITLVSSLSVAGYFFIRRRKEDR